MMILVRASSRLPDLTQMGAVKNRTSQGIMLLEAITK
jgi:hypothetical protein